jgi:hypothetical protein
LPSGIDWIRGRVSLIMMRVSGKSHDQDRADFRIMGDNAEVGTVIIPVNHFNSYRVRGFGYVEDPILIRPTVCLNLGNILSRSSASISFAPQSALAASMPNTKALLVS